MKPEPDELELAIRARNGDQAALSELIERLRVGLFALAYAELRHYEDAEDAVAAALYQICCHAVNLRDPKSMRAWMYTIVRNQTHRMRRGKQAMQASLDVAVSVAIEDPAPLLRLDIERALRQLPRDQAHALGLFYLRGWPIAKIARHLARPIGTIKCWLHQGRQRLATEMKGYVPMNKVWKACIVAPDLTPAQLQAITGALKTAGFSDVQNVAEVRSLDDLYQLNMPPRSTFAQGTIGISNEGGFGVGTANRVDTRLVLESADQQVRIDGLFSDQSFIRLAEPLASCDFLLLGERIAGHSAFEFMTLVRAIAPTLRVCLLYEASPSDFTEMVGWVGGFTKLHTLSAEYSEQRLQYLRESFSDVRTRLEKETAG